MSSHPVEYKTKLVTNSEPPAKINPAGTSKPTAMCKPAAISSPAINF